MAFEVWAIRLRSWARVVVALVGFGLILLGLWRSYLTAVEARDAAILIGQPVQTFVGPAIIFDVGIAGIGVIVVWLSYR